MNPVTHFELPFHDAARASSFYKNVFSWELHPLGAEMGNYILATTAIDDVKPGAPAGSINGGFYPYNADQQAQYPSIVIGVRDIQESIKSINENGGKVLGEPHMIPNFGLHIYFHDTEGNRNSIMQPIGI